MPPEQNNKRPKDQLTEELTMGQNPYLNELRLVNLFRGLRHYLSDHHLMYNKDHQLSEEEAKPVRDLIIGLIESREVMRSSLVAFEKIHPKPRSNNGPSNAEIYDGYIAALLKNVAELSENKTLKSEGLSTKSDFIQAKDFDQALAKFNKQKEFVKSNKLPELLAQAYNEVGAKRDDLYGERCFRSEFGKSTRIIPKINLQQVLERCKDLKFMKNLGIVNENLLNDPKAQQDWQKIYTENLKKYRASDKNSGISNPQQTAILRRVIECVPLYKAINLVIELGGQIKKSILEQNDANSKKGKQAIVSHIVDTTTDLVNKGKLTFKNIYEKFKNLAKTSSRGKE